MIYKLKSMLSVWIILLHFCGFGGLIRPNSNYRPIPCPFLSRIVCPGPWGYNDLPNWYRNKIIISLVEIDTMNRIVGAKFNLTASLFTILFIVCQSKMVIIIIKKLKVGTRQWINTSYNIIGRVQLGPRSALPNFNDESPPPQMRMGIREGTAGRLKNFYKTRDGHMYKYNISEQVPPVWLILSSRCCCGLSPSPHPASELRSGWARESTCVVTIPSMIHWTGTYVSCGL